MIDLNLSNLGNAWLTAGIDGLICDKVDAGVDNHYCFFVYKYKRFGQTFLITPPLSPYSYESQPLDSAECLENYLTLLEKKFPRASIDLSLKVPHDLKAEIAKYGYEVLEKKSHVLDLSGKEKDLWSALSTNRKRLIKKSDKNHVLRWDADKSKAFSLFRETYRSNEMSVPEDFFSALERGALAKNQITAQVFDGEELLASNLCLVIEKTAFYLLGGINTDIKNNSAGTYSLWNCVLKSREMGADNFDFCGSSVPGISRYFKSFGAEEFPYLQIKKGHKKVEMLKKLKSRLSI